MTTTEHLTFLALLIPTFVLLMAAAVSLADIGAPPPVDAPRHETPY
jgi:hypothetical protein